MEEKLYFKPSFFGKKKKTERKEQYKRIINLIIFVIIIVAIAILIILLLKNKESVSGAYPESVRNEALTCDAKNKEYEKAGIKEPEDANMRLNLVFSGEKSLKTISMVYTINHESSKEAYSTEAFSHATFNKNLTASGYDVSMFDNKYARYDNKLIISLTANSNEIDEVSAPYFLISLNDEHKVNLKTLNEYQEMYESIGFTCTSTLTK